jgi:hypothetical protein
MFKPFNISVINKTDDFEDGFSTLKLSENSKILDESKYEKEFVIRKFLLQFKNFQNKYFQNVFFESDMKENSQLLVILKDFLNSNYLIEDHFQFMMERTDFQNSIIELETLLSIKYNLQEFEVFDFFKFLIFDLIVFSCLNLLKINKEYKRIKKLSIHVISHYKLMNILQNLVSSKLDLKMNKLWNIKELYENKRYIEGNTFQRMFILTQLLNSKVYFWKLMTNEKNLKIFNSLLEREDLAQWMISCSGKFEQGNFNFQNRVLKLLYYRLNPSVVHFTPKLFPFLDFTHQ